MMNIRRGFVRGGSSEVACAVGMRPAPQTGLEAARGEEENEGPDDRKETAARPPSAIAQQSGLSATPAIVAEKDRPAAEAFGGKPHAAHANIPRSAPSPSTAHGHPVGEPNAASNVGSTAKRKACAEVLSTSATATIQRPSAASNLVTEGLTPKDSPKDRPVSLEES